MKRHQPKHIYADNEFYCITSHIYDCDFLLDTEFKKDKLLLKIFSFAWEYGIELHSWALLTDHYHVLFKVTEGNKITDFIAGIHRGFSFEINEMEQKRGRKLWQNYWDKCIRDELDYWRHFNYIHNNPIKHGLVANMMELGKYRYSSYWNYRRQKGEEWLVDAVEKYPVIDFTIEDND